MPGEEVAAGPGRARRRARIGATIAATAPNTTALGWQQVLDGRINGAPLACNAPADIVSKVTIRRRM